MTDEHLLRAEFLAIIAMGGSERLPAAAAVLHKVADRGHCCTVVRSGDRSSPGRFPNMTEWLKDWAPILAPTAALIGVLVTVKSASRTYRRGQAEARKDRQRNLIADLIIGTRRMTTLLHVYVVAAGKFQKEDMFEWVETDSGKRQGELNEAFREASVKTLCEIRDPKLRPLIIDLAVQHRGLMSGDDAEPLHDHRKDDDTRFEAVLVVLRRIRDIEHTCDKLEMAAIEVLPVEIDLPTFRSRMRDSRLSKPRGRSSP